MRIAVACAFNENAIWSISQYASQHGLLAQRLVPNWSLTADVARTLSAVTRSEALEGFRARKEARLRNSALPEDLAVSRLTEVIRIAGGRTKTPVTPFLGHYAWKAEFDLRASRHLDSDGIDVLIGMPGSSERIFREHARPLRVFHAIDTHPRARNRALVAAYGGRAWSEAHPPLLAARIERELGMSDLVLAPSRLVADQMVRYGVPADRVLRIPYGVDLERFTPAPASPSPESRRPRVIFVGQISLRKGVPLLLDAVRGLDLDVTLAGQVFDRSTVAHLPDNVTLRGVLSPAQLADAYKDHDAMVLPTVDDACSLVVAEAAASGLRVLTTDANGAAELLPPEHVVLPAGDVPSLRSALEAVPVLTPEDRDRISSGLRSGATGDIRSWRSYAEDVVSALEGRRTGAAPAVL
ncbi:glycosyltransferase family 4 protein [Geodermatophilus sp. SYSU D01119]